MNTAIKRQRRDWFHDDKQFGHNLPIQHRNAAAPAFSMPYLWPFSQLFMNMDTMFEHAFNRLDFPFMAGAGQWNKQKLLSPMFNPSIDIVSDEDKYVVTAELPGIDERDINIDLSAEGLLTIRGEKRQEHEDMRQNIESIECSYGMFQRTLSLPQDVNHDAIEAHFKNGVLSIVCLRKDKAQMPYKQIPVGGHQQHGMRAANTSERERGVAGSSQSPKKAA